MYVNEKRLVKIVKLCGLLLLSVIEAWSYIERIIMHSTLYCNISLFGTFITITIQHKIYIIWICRDALYYYIIIIITVPVYYNYLLPVS